ncbi:kinase-like protein [Mycena metata]|uniref:Kinase-like protein n=1 Tax=Mycena metata TaxID=1033252 RepID=A0AAD7K731_9AGAR|nr:kinase-like protein [Mycena metata]
MPAADGYGWAQLEFGDSVGDDQEYTILRKLGWGMHASTWLARDRIGNGFVAIKALTGHITQMNEKGLCCEAQFRILSGRSKDPALWPQRHCVRLLDEFVLPGRGSAGSHVCFVMPVYGGDVKALVASRKTHLELPTAKRIGLHLLRGITFAHDHRLVHTDLKHDNIFFTTELQTADIERWLEADPSRRHEPESSYDGTVRAALSQPLPMITDELARRATYVLSDFGCGVLSDLHDDRTITTPPLRAPESFLGGKWDTPADIWSFGCLAFELVVNNSLFKYRTNEKWKLTEDENILYQMLLVTSDEGFEPEQLTAWPRSGEFFSEDCNLQKKPTVFQWPLDHIISTGNPAISPADVTALANLMYRCLRLNPANRPTAKELLEDPWFEGADD